MATAFPLIGSEFHVGLGSQSYLISLFIVGYGLAHIPGGMLATTIGMKRTLVAGLTLRGLASLSSGLSYGHLVEHTSFTFGWEFLAAITFAFALVGLLGRNPADATILVTEEEPTRAAPRLVTDAELLFRGR